MGELKIATRAHLADLIALDRRCFPDGDPTLEPAGRGELERGVERGSVLLVENDDQVVAYLHWEQPGATAGIARYEWSRFALHARYPDRRRFRLLATMTAVLPAAAAAAPSTDGWMWAWSTLAIVVLGIRFALAVPATFDERARASRPQGWQVRR